MQKKKSKKRNIHDENFKHNFMSKNVAHDFLKHNLPKKVLKKIKLETVRVEGSELLPSRYRSKRNSDIIYSVESRKGERLYALIHLEAQSTHDQDMAIRLWEYHVAIGRNYLKKGYKKIPLIITFVLYHGAEEWTSANSISALFSDFDLYSSVSLISPFLVNLTKEEIEELKKQGAAAAPQIIMKQQATGEYCEILPDLWRLMKKYDQVNEENIDYIATNDKHGELVFLEKFSKLDPRTANDYKIMFEQAIQKTEKRALRLGKKEGIQKGIQKGLEQGIQAIRDLFSKGFLTQEQAKKAEEAIKAQEK